MRRTLTAGHRLAHAGAVHARNRSAVAGMGQRGGAAEEVGEIAEEAHAAR